MTSGDAGCITYDEARTRMPDTPVPETDWGEWVADTDTQMTGTCT